MYANQEITFYEETHLSYTILKIKTNYYKKVSRRMYKCEYLFIYINRSICICKKKSYSYFYFWIKLITSSRKILM